jgi:hypothetical protein
MNRVATIEAVSLWLFNPLVGPNGHMKDALGKRDKTKQTCKNLIKGRIFHTVHHTTWRGKVGFCGQKGRVIESAYS